MTHRHLLALLTAVLAVLACRAGYDSDARAYIARFSDAALAAEREFGVPASITLAQGILESGCGKSKLTLQSNNHFGIKGKGTVGSVKAKDDEVGLSTFRAYRNAAESYADHARLLSKDSKYYGKLHQYSVYDYRSWAYGIKACGYATAPNYAQSLIGIIERFQLYKLNHGRKLRGGTRTVKVIVGYRLVPVKGGTEKQPEFNDDDVLDDDVVTDEEHELDEAVKRYPTDLLINEVPCVGLMPGKTLTTICRDYGIDDPAKLLKYNEVDRADQLPEGSIVFLDKKKKSYEGPSDFYYTRQGDTLHSVSQRFGIQVRRLAKRNGMSDVNAPLKKGIKLALK